MALPLDLTGRRVLVTGAGQGVGRGIVLAFAQAGAAVVVNDIDADRAAAVAAEAAELGVDVVGLAFDVTDHGAVREAVGGLDIDVLVNNAGNAGTAGFGALGLFVDSTPADWEPYLAVNLYGVLHCSHAVLAGMVERGWGRIITIVSDAGRTGDAHMAAYSAAKAGAAGFTRSLARETGRHGITVNNVALGTMRTEVTEPLWSDPDHPQAKAMMQAYVVRRPGTGADVGPIAVFLATDHAAWITGQTYPVNGGYSFAL